MSSMQAGANKGFVFGEAGDDQPNKILDIVEVQTYMIGYTDDRGQVQTAMGFRYPGSPKTYILKHSVSGTRMLNAGTDWFNKAVINALKQKGLEAAPGEGVEGITQA